MSEPNKVYWLDEFAGFSDYQPTPPRNGPFYLSEERAEAEIQYLETLPNFEISFGIASADLMPWMEPYINQTERKL